MKKRYLSAQNEPALTGGQFEVDPAEDRAAATGTPEDDLGVLRDSVAAEPALPRHRSTAEWQSWLKHQRGQCSWLGNVSVTMATALLGGPFAILGAIISGGQGFGPGLYVVVFAPVAEELLKQSGMIYLLEKKPYRVFSPMQFVLAAVVSGAIFATIENFVYILQMGEAENAAELAAFRWVVCTSLHVVCAAIASLGLVRAWHRHLAEHRPAELADAYPWFLAAMILHGGYNTWAVFFGPSIQ